MITEVVVVITKFNKLLNMQEQVPVSNCRVTRITKTMAWVLMSGTKQAMPYSLKDGSCSWKPNLKLGRKSLALLQQETAPPAPAEESAHAGG